MASTQVDNWKHLAFIKSRFLASLVAEEIVTSARGE